jgi:hypothetical protein
MLLTVVKNLEYLGGLQNDRNMSLKVNLGEFENPRFWRGLEIF